MIAVSLTSLLKSTIEQLSCRLKDTPLNPAESAVFAGMITLLSMRGLTPVQCADLVLYERAQQEFEGCERLLLDVVINALKQRECTEQDISSYVADVARIVSDVASWSRCNATAGAE